MKTGPADDALHPQVRRMRDQRAADGAPQLYTLSLAEARRADLESIRAAAGTGEPVGAVLDLTFPGPDGDLPVRVYRPRTAATPAPSTGGAATGGAATTADPSDGLPVVVYFFGGGWTLGSIDTADGVARTLANAVPAVVVVPGYRLAPEHPFPAAVEDCYAAVQWVASAAPSFGADPGRLAVAGDSAGGNLAAAVALMSRDRGGAALAGQALVYPNVDNTAEDESLRSNTDPWLFNATSVAWYRGHYLGGPGDAADPRASPLLADDHRGLPPALVVTAEFDPLRDQGERYADRLAAAGVPVRLSRYEGMVHGFFTMTGTVDAAGEAQRQVAGQIRDWFDPPRRTYAHAALDRFAGFGDAPAVVSGGRRISYAQLRAQVLDLAAGLHALGVRSGDGVAVLLANPAEGPALALALHLLGCRAAWLAPNTADRHLDEFVLLADVAALVYETAAYGEQGTRLAGAFPDLPVGCLGPDGAGPDLLAASGQGPGLLAASGRRPDVTALARHEPQSLFQTGGTTGRPKLVHHRERFFRVLTALAEHYAAAGEPPLRHLSVSAFWHVSGQVPAFITLFSGGTYLPERVYDVREVLATIERERVTSVFLTPPLLSFLLDHPAWQERDYDTGSITMLTIGSSAASPSRLRAAIERFGPVLRPAYGLSEAAFVSALPRLGADPARTDLLASCGQPYGDMRIEIRDAAGRPLPHGADGQVWVTGGLVMSGYWGDPALTAATLVDGWVATGDVGHLDAEGHLFLVDRLKDMIITGYGSTNVYCRPVEDCLAAHPDVAAAAVVGVPDERYGEVVHACVVRRPGGTVSAAELRARVVAEHGERCAPRDVEFVDALPITGAGKVDKVALRARHPAGAGSRPR